MRLVAELAGAGRTFHTDAEESVVALHPLSLRIHSHELLVIRGPSGCGKSTLLNILGLLDRPTTGEVFVQGAATHQLSSAAFARLRREHTAFLFQDAGLIEGMSVRANIALPLAYRDIPNTERVARVEGALRAVGLMLSPGARVNNLSGGERQRVGLARAIAARPALLICDEPTASLDAENGKRIIDLLKAESRGGRAVVCSTHDPRLIEAAHSVIELAHGRVVSG